MKLEYAYAVQVAQSLSKCDEDLIQKAIASPDRCIRAAGIINLTRFDNERNIEILVHALEDPSASVLEKQWARRVLIIKSAKKLGKGKGYVDFGPPPNSTIQRNCAAAKMWHNWFGGNTMINPFDQFEE